uniref:Cytochrome P450 n=1 Tax=Cuerna arida TaxID=1464854 RepID=A0A1B6GAY2_9HEMI
MAALTGSVLIDLLLAVASLLCFAYWFITSNDDYWDKRGVPNTKKGLIRQTLLGQLSQGDRMKQMYKEFAGERYFGFFQVRKEGLIIRDPKLINLILVKDFSHFQDRPSQPKHDPISKSLFGLKGRMWRALRYKLTPTFTTGKLRGMFEQVSKCGDNMMKTIEKHSPTEGLETKNLLFEFTLDVISSCAFGVQYHPDSAEFKEFKLFVEKAFAFSPFKLLKLALMLLAPKVAEFFKMSTTPGGTRSYFINLTKATIKYRKDNNIQRNDYFQLLLTLKEQEESGKEMGLSMSDATEEDAVVNQMQYTGESNESCDTSEKLFSEEVISANTFIFLIAGSETVARTISFVLFSLTQHPEIQQRLQEEVDSVLAKHGHWSYEAIRSLTYLDQVVQETQRMYPIIPMLVRECIQPYKVPDSDLTIEKGVIVMIPVVALHHDPQYYPDPEQFKPERFQGNNFKPSSTFLPFGDGPRICIAMRFALMEVKSCVAKVVSQYSVKLHSKTQLPLKFKVRSFVPAVEGDIWLSFEKRRV